MNFIGVLNHHLKPRIDTSDEALNDEYINRFAEKQMIIPQISEVNEYSDFEVAEIIKVLAAVNNCKRISMKKTNQLKQLIWMKMDVHGSSMPINALVSISLSEKSFKFSFTDKMIEERICELSNFQILKLLSAHSNI
jgi:hypothetical protein